MAESRRTVSTPPTFRGPDPGIPFTVRFSQVEVANLQRLARAQSLNVGQLVQRLAEAAYSAKCRPTGDRALDRAVADMDRVTVTGSPELVIDMAAVDAVMGDAGLAMSRRFDEAAAASVDAFQHMGESAHVAAEDVPGPASAPPEAATPAEESNGPRPAEPAVHHDAPERAGAAAASGAGGGDLLAGGAAVPAQGAAGSRQAEPIPCEGAPPSVMIATQDCGPVTMLAADAKLVRLLHALGNSVNEIVAETSLPKDAVKAVIAQNRRSR